MNFLLRGVRHDDLNQLVDLAKQFSLLNLPGDRSVLAAKIERSEQSFAKKLPKEKAEYLFVIEDIEEKLICGSSLVIAKHGTDEVPHCFFKVLKKDHFSKDLGIGFIHQVLRFQLDYDGPTEIGGLLVDRAYRRRPERLGRQISLIRFLYMAMFPNDFEKRVLCELTPPLTEEGRSEFWEALGRRFTGLPYQEADLLSQNQKEFIESLFPSEDIYMCLLDARARLVLGRVAEPTKPAQYLLEKSGFNYLEEVDPFDGGPHYGARTEDIVPIKLKRKAHISQWNHPKFENQGLVAINSNEFRAALTYYDLRGDEICLPPKILNLLGAEMSSEVFFTPFDF